MSNNEKFDWYRYYEHAQSYHDETDPAKLRTGIGRFYYSSFLESRDFILENKTFLNKFNRKIMNSQSGRIHQETSHTFDKHPSLNQRNVGKKNRSKTQYLKEI